jgi:hypothetical protein
MIRCVKAVFLLLALALVLVVFLVRLAGLMFGNKVLAGLGIGVSAKGEDKHVTY